MMLRSANEAAEPSAPLAKELMCPICLQLFSEPVSLPCGHMYCFDCLQTMGAGLDQHSCPECQAQYNGTTDLVKNTKMCSIVEAYKMTAGKLTPALNPFDSRDSHTKPNEDAATATQSACSTGDVEIGSPSAEESISLNQEESSNKGSMQIEKPKLELTSQVTDLSLKLEMAEEVLRKEKIKELEVTTGNHQLREKVSRLLGQVRDLSQRYCEQVTQLVEEELGPGEATMCSRVSKVSEVTKQLRQAVFRAESLLTEDDETVLTNEMKSLQPHISELIAKPVEEEDDPVDVTSTRACPKLEIMNTQLKQGLGEIHRSLRNTFNPSEVTFDPETAHPNLLLSNDLKTVTFAAVKQPYPPSDRRFTSFLQVLSTESFSEGAHRWEVELDGAPWIIGFCHSEKLARSGLPSALESSENSWCLMWHNNMLSAFEQGRSVPLMKTTLSCRLEITLSFNTKTLSFYNISATSGNTHIYTFKIIEGIREPVHLAYRMMSGNPKAHITIS